MHCSGVVVCLFFSIRRRHTIYWRDWSSDVCSSDLTGADVELPRLGRALGLGGELDDRQERGAVARGVVRLGLDLAGQIGRASGRERVEISVVAGSLKKKM